MERIERAIIYVGLGLAFLKTGEAMAAYAPRAVFGWKSDWVSYVWAYLGAFMVEGVLYVAYHKLVTPGKDRSARLAAWAVAVISVVFSLVMNKIDQSITDGTLATIAGSSPLAVLHNVVFAIPLVGAALFMLMDIIDKATPDLPGQRPGKGPGRHDPIVRWTGAIKASERPLPPAQGQLADGSEDDITALLGSPSASRKFQTDVPSVTTLVSRRHPETLS